MAVQAISKERERLLDIIAKPYPAKNQGCATRNWEHEHFQAKAELERLDATNATNATNATGAAVNALAAEGPLASGGDGLFGYRRQGGQL